MDPNQTVNVSLLSAKLAVDEASEAVALSRLFWNRSWDINGKSRIAQVINQIYDWNSIDNKSFPLFVNQTDIFARKAEFFGQH